MAIGDFGVAADHFGVKRSKAFVFFVVVVVAVALGATASAARTGTAKATQLRSLNRDVAAAINDFRRAHHLPLLRVRTQLNSAARQHSVEMGTDGYFDHPSADGTVFWKRIAKYYPTTHYRYWTVGENLLFASPDIGADAAMQQWIGSPEHLANLKNKNWRDLGVSAVYVPDAGGVYGGNPVTIITTDFGARH